jgi:hypothetical protein
VKSRFRLSAFPSVSHHRARSVVIVIIAIPRVTFASSSVLLLHHLHHIYPLPPPSLVHGRLKARVVNYPSLVPLTIEQVRTDDADEEGSDRDGFIEVHGDDDMYPFMMMFSSSSSLA